MKKILYGIALVALFLGYQQAEGQKLVLIGTNDTHSQIDPDEDGLGGVLRRKVLVDSIRNANDNVLLIDMGDPVQGTMYFNLYRGEVENMVMNELGYDVRILGNHDFDNGVIELADNLNKTRSEYVSTNYRFDDPILSTIFKPYIVKDIDGKKVAFLGVNLQPKGMIAEGNYDGVSYLDAIKAANSTAWHLKHNEGVDFVVALTHIGYSPSGTGTSDTELALLSEDIDIIMGGHSHTMLNPKDPDSKPWLLLNADGDDIVVTQAGKGGKAIAVAEIDLTNNMVDYKTIPVDSRLDNRLDSLLDSKIEPYRKGVNEVMQRPVGKLSAAADKGSDALLNLVADFIRDRGRQLDSDVDFAITNKGGIRRGLPKGTITQGQIQSMLPFNNKVVVLEMKGSDLQDAFNIMTGSYGAGVSDEVTVVTDAPNGIMPIINGKVLDPDKIYKVATIDYLANGGDYMEPLTRGVWVAQSTDKVYDDVLLMLTKGKYKGKTIKPDAKSRFVTANSIGLYF
ncbi:MAG: bifunctional metallophosphatase/5'-nucleotidase [Muribaculaceae bacterium]|nr:bifunctional metallophosphatase/5'-nucleotidase [Muribaculaceae bacterium]